MSDGRSHARFSHPQIRHPGVTPRLLPHDAGYDVEWGDGSSGDEPDSRGVSPKIVGLGFADEIVSALEARALVAVRVVGGAPRPVTGGPIRV